MSRYKHRLDDEAIVMPLTDSSVEHKIQCCDCGLVHLITFEVNPVAIIMRAYRDNRATAQVRRHMKREATR